VSRTIGKVTAFIIRGSQTRGELLLIEHPNAGIQVPAGTVEAGETVSEAVLREAAEETGLAPLSISRYLGCVKERLPEGHRVIAEPTRVYCRPDATSFDWAYLRSGIPVTVSRRIAGFSQVTYEEHDRVPDPQYVTMSITGWVPDGVLACSKVRHFFLLEYQGDTKQHWTVSTDNHRFRLFWAPLNALPAIIPPQDQWLAFLPPRLAEAGHGLVSEPGP
jgi:8-oxo-dGTP pyrophosphatase MutT (NUDIX family)